MIRKRLFHPDVVLCCPCCKWSRLFPFATSSTQGEVNHQLIVQEPEAELGFPPRRIWKIFTAVLQFTRMILSVINTLKMPFVESGEPRQILVCVSTDGQDFVLEANRRRGRRHGRCCPHRWSCGRVRTLLKSILEVGLSDKKPYEIHWTQNYQYNYC